MKRRMMIDLFIRLLETKAAEVEQSARRGEIAGDDHDEIIFNDGMSDGLLYARDAVKRYLVQE